jgi:predicted PurR-regulated permease PerM
MFSSMGVMPAPIANMIGSFAWIFVLFYLLALACVFFLSLFHLKFSNGITRAMNFTDQQAFTAAWRNFRNHFRLYGIMVIVFIALYIIMIIAVLTMVGTATSSQFN